MDKSSESNPKVSVLMLAYNVGKYVETAIQGVLSQITDFPYELVIGEDYSTDNTYEICKRYQESYPDIIRVLRRDKNLGVAKNTMDTYSHCRGEYITYCDSDDYMIDRHRLQIMTDFMDSHKDFGLCFHRMLNYYEDTGVKSLSNGGQKQVTDIVDLAAMNYITTSSVMIRRANNETFPDWVGDEVLCDYAVQMLNAEHGKIYYFSRPMAVYRKRSFATFSKIDADKRLLMSLSVRKKLIEYFKDNEPVRRNLLMATSNIYYALISFYRANGNEERVAEMFKEMNYYFPECTIEELQEREQDHAAELEASKKSMKGRIRSFMSFGRAMLSHLVPVPKVKWQPNINK